MQARDMLLNDAMMTAIRCELENSDLRDANRMLSIWLVVTHCIIFGLVAAIAFSTGV